MRWVASRLPRTVPPTFDGNAGPGGRRPGSAGEVSQFGGAESHAEPQHPCRIRIREAARAAEVEAEGGGGGRDPVQVRYQVRDAVVSDIAQESKGQVPVIRGHPPQLGFGAVAHLLTSRLHEGIESGDDGCRWNHGDEESARH